MSAGATPHRRQNPLTGEWVLVSPHRLQRPWQGAQETSLAAAVLAHEPTCHLCPGNARMGGQINPDYCGVHVFANDYPALLRCSDGAPEDRLLRSEPETGICRVMCYAPRHDLALGRLGVAGIEAVIDAWASQFDELAAHDDIAAVTIFENRGEMMGASSPHPHGQIWATSSIPNELAREDAHQLAHWQAHGQSLLLDYLARELSLRERIVCESRDWVALVPFWAVWPFETLVLPRSPVADLASAQPMMRQSLAPLLEELTARYDALFGVPFPYSMGWHQRPARARAAPHFQLHAHFYPPLLRSATLRKFMVGFEMLAMPQRDMTPEAAAARLRAVVP